MSSKRLRRRDFEEPEEKAPSRKRRKRERQKIELRRPAKKKKRDIEVVPRRKISTPSKKKKKKKKTKERSEGREVQPKLSLEDLHPMHLEPWHQLQEGRVPQDGRKIRDAFEYVCNQLTNFENRRALITQQTNEKDKHSLYEKLDMDIVDDFRMSQVALQASTLASHSKTEKLARVADKVIRRHNRAFHHLLMLPKLNRETLLETHRILLKGEKGAGELRKSRARAGKTRFPPPDQVPELFDTWIKNFAIMMNRVDLSPLAIASWAGLNFVVIHPFSDGNGRMMRIIINWVLNARGLLFPIALHANQTQRGEYISAIKRHVTEGFVPLARVILLRVHVALLQLEKTKTAKEKERAEQGKNEAVRDWRVDQKRRGGCVICFENECDIAVLCCGKPYHIKCLTPWVKSSKNCPACREGIKFDPPRVLAPRRERRANNGQGGPGQGGYQRLTFMSNVLLENLAVMNNIIRGEPEGEGPNDVWESDDEETTTTVYEGYSPSPEERRVLGEDNTETTVEDETEIVDDTETLEEDEIDDETTTLVEDRNDY